ncbi:MAG: phospho-N-acetylmuramoyl-pentapeptide-transferase [Acidimicrobiaceae bacterium]|nr:phospho-N-acetylmuramoyl-pentapeptide-transferase [Acidimicrobiaceae bacterium]
MIRLLIAAGVAMVVSLFGTTILIKLLKHLKIGQPIRDDSPESHSKKAGTPTMGGIAVVAAATLGYIVSDFFGGIYTESGIIVMLTIIGAAAVGLVDDWLKVRANYNRGLNKKMKMTGLLIVSVGFAVAMSELTTVQTTLSFTRFNYPGIELGQIGWSIWAILLIIASTNAVNLTDGLDGLAAGAGIFCYAAFVIIGLWQFDHYESYKVFAALDLAIIAAAMVGGIVGFLWWNTAPAQIFMGDTGALAIGSGLAALSLATNTQLLLAIVGGLFVLETISVILQISSFHWFGRRIFNMTPLHHHFEIRGWPETTVIVRFWIFSGMCVAVGLGLFYADAIASGVLDVATSRASSG